MNHPLVMGILQGVGHGGDQLGRFAKAGAAGRQQVGQRHAADEVADQVRQAILLADLVDADDRRMPQLGDAASLAQESVQGGWSGQVAGSGHLDGDHAIQLRIAGLEEGAEGPAADGLDQVEPADAAPEAGFGAGGGVGF